MPSARPRPPPLLGALVALLAAAAATDASVGCIWNEDLKQNGATWLKDDCTICKCDDGIAVCTEKELCPEISPSCLEKITPKGECCPVCLTDSASCVVHSQGEVMKNGQKWQEDPCTTCTCIDGKKECMSFTCETKCLNPKHIDNECCPICEDDESYQAVSNCSAQNCSLECPNGFTKNESGCFLCECNLVAHKEEKDKEIVENHEDDDVDDEIEDDIEDDLYPVDDGFSGTMCKTSYGDLYGDGGIWFDGCRQCYCHGGSEMCNLITCPIITCDNPIFNPSVDCCPHCSGDKSLVPEEQPNTGCFSVDGVYHVEGEMWSLNKCTKCLCHSGQVMCKAEECPPIPCLNPVYKDGLCCPFCENLTVPSFKDTVPCTQEGRLHGETWRENNCSSCICIYGKTECFSQKCPEKQCDKLVLIKNQCCPMCLDIFSGKSPAETPVFNERTYSIIIGLLFLLVTIMGFYLMWHCYKKKQFKLGSLKTCSGAAYSNYMHRDSYAPPRYTSAERQTKCEPCHYKYVPSYDTTQFNDYIKSSSFGTTEKTALAPV